MESDVKQLLQTLQQLINRETERYEAKLDISHEVYQLVRLIQLDDQISLRHDRFFIDTLYNRIIHASIVRTDFQATSATRICDITEDRDSLSHYAIEVRFYPFETVRQANQKTKTYKAFFRTLLSDDKCLEFIVPGDDTMFEEWFRRYFLQRDADFEGLTLMTCQRLGRCTGQDHPALPELKNQMDILSQLAKHPWHRLKNLCYVCTFSGLNMVTITVPASAFPEADFAEYIFLVDMQDLYQLLPPHDCQTQTTMMWAIENMSKKERYDLLRAAIQKGCVITGYFKIV